MRYAGREYRVVCTKSDTKPLIIDIMPADKALHQLILQERKLRDASTKEIAGSISLYDMGEGNKPDIFFLPAEHGGLSTVELSEQEENRLRYKITARFEEMMAQNQESTIVIRPEIHQTYVTNICADMISKIKNTVNTADAPQSLREEQNRILSERRKHSAATRAQTTYYLKQRDKKYTASGLSALQVKQLLYRDY